MQMYNELIPGKRHFDLHLPYSYGGKQSHFTQVVNLKLKKQLHYSANDMELIQS